MQETVGKLLSSSFKDDKTRRELNRVNVHFHWFVVLLTSVFFPCLFVRTVSGDAVMLMVEMLKVFVQGNN